MRAYEIRGQFGLEHLVACERPDPEPGPGQVRVRVRATSLNARDLMMVEGRYNPRQKLPLVPNSDGAGVVDAVGPGVTRVKVGDRVMGTFVQGWLAGEPTRAALATTLGGPLDGALADMLLLSAEGVVPTPAHLSDVEASTLPCAAATAWSALVTHGRVKPGDSVLLQGTGGVSVFALQLAKLLGARVLLTSSSDAKLARARELGADETLNSTATPEWDRWAKGLTGGAGVDHVVEVGGAGTMERSLRAVRPGGTVSVIGVLAGGAGPVPLTAVLMQNLRLQGILVGHRENFEALCRAVAQHALRPVVDRVFPFSEAREAFAHLRSGAHFGKVVVQVE